MCVKCVTCHYNKIIIIIIINAWSKTPRPSTRPSTQNDVKVVYNYTRFHCTNNCLPWHIYFMNAICWYLIVSQYVLSRTVESTTTASIVSIV